MAMPDGSVQGASFQRCVTLMALASISTISEVSSMLSKMWPAPSATANSGLPPSAIVPSTVPEATSMAVALLLPALKVKTRCVLAS